MKPRIKVHMQWGRRYWRCDQPGTRTALGPTPSQALRNWVELKYTPDLRYVYLQEAL